MNPFQAPNIGPAGKDFGNREEANVCIICGKDAPHTPYLCFEHWCEEWNEKVRINHPDVQEVNRVVENAILRDAIKYGSSELPKLTRVNGDQYGNPRYVAHWHSVLTEKEYDDKRTYEYAVRKANKVGGRKFHNRQYGGGIVFFGGEDHVIQKVMKLAKQEGV